MTIKTIREETRTQRAKRTRTWREMNHVDAIREKSGIEAEEAHLVTGQAYLEIGLGGINGFMDQWERKSYWR